MISTPSWLLAALLCSTVLATPIKAPIEKRSFTVHRVRNVNYTPHGPAALRKAYAKYGLTDLAPLAGGAVANNLAAAKAAPIRKDQSGSTPNQGIQDDLEFVAPVLIGGQTVVMDFDTGSSDMWVFNTQLPSAAQTGHTIYDPSKSTTASSMTGGTFNITYGDGSFASGSVGYDTVDIGGAVVAKQAIGLPNHVANSFAANVASNGLVGLAFSKLNSIKPQQQKTFFENVQANLAEPVFTANLKHGVAGAYTFGAVDTTQFSGPLTNVPVNGGSGLWEFASTQFAVGNNATQPIPTGSTAIAIADTGTSLLILDNAIVMAYYAQVAGAALAAQRGGWVFPCNAALPDLHLAVGPSYMATISSSLMIFNSVGTNVQNQLMCFGAVQSNGGAGFQIFGDIFFKSQFVVFNSTGPSLGVAPHN